MPQPDLIPAPSGIVAVFVDATGDRHARVVCGMGSSTLEDASWAAYVIDAGSGLAHEAATLPGFVGVIGAGQTLESDAPHLVAKAAEVAKSFGEDARLALEDLKETRAGSATDDIKIRGFIQGLDRDE